jgi:hypothetical protein
MPGDTPLGWFLTLAGLVLLLTLGGFWRQARRRANWWAGWRRV